MAIPDVADTAKVSGEILIVDDDRVIRALHRGMLARQFDVRTVASGEEALAACAEKLPDLVVLDVEMPGMDGYETCRRLRIVSGVPIIFATARQTLDEHLKAFDAGGNDILTKPVSSEILLRKAALAIQSHRATTQLMEEQDSLRAMAMGFLSSMGESGTLLNFMRASVACQSHGELASRLVEAARDFGVECSILIRHTGGPTILKTLGEPTPLECAILEQASVMGRLFQFQRRLAVNYDRVSIMVTNMPDEKEQPEQAGRIRDNIVILAETTEALCANVDMRCESAMRAEQLQVALGTAEHVVQSIHQGYLGMLGDTRLLLQELVESVEKTYSWLDTNQAQESAISRTMDHSVQRILALMSERGDFESRFAEVLEALRGGRGKDSVELF